MLPENRKHTAQLLAILLALLSIIIGLMVFVLLVWVWPMWATVFLVSACMLASAFLVLGVFVGN